jgi:hypothetical protein
MGSKLISKDIVNGEKYSELQSSVSDALALIDDIRNK